MKRILDKPYMEGICPCCGSQIEYGQRNHMDNGGTIAWECPNCEASGEEGLTKSLMVCTIMSAMQMVMNVYMMRLQTKRSG